MGPRQKPHGAKPGTDAQDVDARLRDAFTADDPEAAWYLDRDVPRVVRVFHGATDVPELTADEVEEHAERYVEVPALTDGELHAWIEDFVDERAEPSVAALLDERQGANARFLRELEARDPAGFAAWTAFHRRRVDEAIAAWRRELA